MNWLSSLLCVVCLLSSAAGLASAQAPQPALEDYGDLPSVRSVAISPDGERVAFIARQNNSEFVVIYDVAKMTVIRTVGLAKIAARGVSFVTDDYVLVNVSRTTRQLGYKGRFEYSGAYSVEVESGEVTQMLQKTEGLYPAQSGLGRVVGQLEGEDEIFMPAYTERGSSDPTFDLYKVSLKTGKGRAPRRGVSKTFDWIVSPDGRVLAREDFDASKKRYGVQVEQQGQLKDIYVVTEAEDPPFSLIGVTPDFASLIVIANADDDQGFGELRKLSFDGKLSEPILTANNRDIGGAFVDRFRRVHGVVYSGVLPSYHFFDPQTDEAVQDVIDSLPNASVSVVGWSDDWSRILFKIFDGRTSGRYAVYDKATNRMVNISDAYLKIPGPAIGEVAAIRYPARDGLAIEAIVTVPPGTHFKSARDLPMIVMPHGGPASYDSIGFDWMAQYFANRGYLVLQPNFRGSTGYGKAFLQAGDGEWGRKMQDDVTDGVKALVDDGFADPSRICIVGASYGGYSALAGGAFTPDLYACIVAIAPVSDLAQMIASVANSKGHKAWSVFYWKRVIGDPSTESDRINSVSPARQASAFKAPVLLVHGKDDTVVSIQQSETMDAALRSAGKSVEFVRLAGEDHWLSDGPTRIATLQAVSDFVERHIGEP